MAGHVYVSRRLTDAAMQRLDALGVPLVVHDDGDMAPSREQLVSDIGGAVGAITMVTETVDDDVLKAAGDALRVVANCAVGIDNIDVDAARRRNVVVTNTPGVLDEATADLTFGLILATARRIVEADRFLRRGPEWIWAPRMFVGLDVSADATLGIIGFGRIGRAVARRAEAFRMRIVVADPQVTDQDAAAHGVELVTLPELLSRSDVVTLHSPLTPQTRHLIGKDELAAMKSKAVVINAARGPIIDEDALVEALEAGRIAGAGLDVHENEPRVHPRLLELDNVVLLPHIGSAGDATRDAMGVLAVENVRAVLAGEEPPTGAS